MSVEPRIPPGQAPFAHDSVMLRETLEAIAPRSGGIYADVTAGGGGHSEALLQASSPDGRVLALDRDPRAVAAVRQRLSVFGARAEVVHADFAQLSQVLGRVGVMRLDGLVADLGVSSPQLDDAQRGFSFSHSGPLDMRMDTSQGETLRDLLWRLSERELADVLYQYGQERKSRPIARSIVRAREAGELQTTADLRRAVLRGAGPPRRGQRSRIDPATRSFQGLRIALNRELEQLEALIAQLADVLQDGAVAAIISFHSLEDRVVKHRFRGDPRLSPLTKRPLSPGEQEQQQNPRARSAKLRAARRVPRGSESLEVPA